MSKQLVVVESPAKARTIEKFLGNDYRVLSSYGHIRDLPKKDFGIDIDKDFEPKYVIPEDKKGRIKELRQAADTASTVWLATDEDREGEAIAWHLMKALKLQPETTKRIAFHEITKSAVTEAIKNPRQVDENLVDAQQARRVLDRLVGYKLSPLLWKKVRPGLSAGRVQSVAVRLIVEKEREIEAFKATRSFKVAADFVTGQNQSLNAELPENLPDEESARKLLEKSRQAQFRVVDTVSKPGTRNPSAPFTTSTLQQTASRQLGYSVRQTMTLAQRLYESGHITYMRTDSTTLSANALGQIETVIKDEYGPDFWHKRIYKNRQGAQEAHEAIRPTDLKKAQASSDPGQQRLYELIRGRTLASQMASAKIDKTIITIASDQAPEYKFEAKGEVVVEPGWLKAYQGIKINDVILPAVATGEAVEAESIEAREVLKRAPARYSEAGLVKKLESMGIGRPSTYAPTISTIQDRGYAEKGEVAGQEEEVTVLTLGKDHAIAESKDKVMYGQDRNKLLPTQIAILVNDFLTANFADIVDYDFTKEAEEEFDRIAKGQEKWNRMIADFYQPFERKIADAETLSREQASGARELGKDPETGKTIIARMGRFGPMLQRGHADDGDEKPDFAPIPKDKRIASISLEEALELLSLPRKVGEDSDGEDIYANYGRFGPYVKAGSLYAPIPEGDNPFSVSQTTARSALAEKRQRKAKQTINEFGNLKVLNGRFGPYVTDGKKNAKIPKGTDPATIDEKQAQEILSQAKKTGKPRRRAKKKTA